MDFVFQNRVAQIIPVEVKSARNMTAKRLRRFMQVGHSAKAYRLCEHDFGVGTVPGTEVPLVSPPLYAAFAITNMR